MTITTLNETYDAEKDAPDFDRPLILTEAGLEFLHAPRLPAYCPGFVVQALGYAFPSVPRFSRFVGIYHGPEGITVFDAYARIETGSEEPAASRRLAVLSAWLESHPMEGVARGHTIGDGEIPASACSVITVDLSNGNLWILPFAIAQDLILGNTEETESDDVTEEQAVDLVYSWLSGEIS